MKTRFLPLIILVAVGLGLVVAGRALIMRKKAALARAPKFGVKSIPVHAVRIRKGGLDRSREYLAVIEPVQRAVLSSRLNAVTIERVECDEGDRVRRGQLLVMLDDREIRDSIDALAARIEQAGADLAANKALIASLEKTAAYWRREAGRDRTLADKKDIPASQAERTADKASEVAGNLVAARQRSNAIMHMVQSLRHEQDTLKTRLGYCRITSPYSGVVTRRLVDPGDLATPGRQLVIVEDRSRLKLAFEVPQEDLRLVRRGNEVRFPVGNAGRVTRISHLYPSLSASRMLRAECELSGEKNKDLTIGSYLTVSVVYQRLKDVMLVPRTSIIECRKHDPHVFVIRDGKLTHPIVKILARGRDLVAVEGKGPGVEPGAMVVTNTFLGWATLSSGLPVEVVE